MTYRIVRHNNKFYALVTMGERIIYKSTLVASFDAAEKLGQGWIVRHS
jgi:hypothetical protein